jgi:nucleoside-diphosphate kinase
MISLKDFINESKEDYVNSFAILKPEFLEHEEEWLNILTDNEWDILDKKKLTLSKEQAQQLYIMHKGKDFYDDLVEYMSSGECLCVKCYKECEDPIEQMDMIKDKIRKKWGKNDMKNAMHSSDSIENVKREAKIVFK